MIAAIAFLSGFLIGCGFTVVAILITSYDERNDSDG